jgi:hypothetical protein
MGKKNLVALALLCLFLLCMSQVQGRNVRPVPLGTPQYSTSQSDCFDNPTYPDPDSIIITVSGNDVVVLHKDAFYNCCFEISVDVVQDDNVFNLYESESGDPCYCMCYFDITTTIYDLEPGTYTINVYNAEGEYVGGGTVTVQKGVGPTPVLR